MSAYVLRAAAALAAVAAATIAIADPGKPTYGTVYEEEINDTFETADVVSALDGPFLDGKLWARQYYHTQPDTFIGVVDKHEVLLAVDDNSSSLGNGKASALLGLAPIDDGEGDTTLRLWITGRPDGLDNNFNGLFFNGPHHQRGEFTVHVTYHVDDMGRGAEGGKAGGIVTESDTREFITGAESFRLNFFPPEGTTSIDVEIDNTTGRWPVCDDVDFYVIEDLMPLCDYVITVIGGMDVKTCEPTRTALGWFDKDGNLVRSNEPTFRAGALHSQLSFLTDTNGRARIAVSGNGDYNFNGLIDFLEHDRNIDAPIPEAPTVHGALACYTILIDSLVHEDITGPTMPPGMPDLPYDEIMNRLEHGDLNMDSGVDVIDLARMLNNYGAVTP